MEKLAARHAWESLHKARNSHGKLVNAQSAGEAESAWSDFLYAAGRIYSKLEKGSKGHSKSEPWFGRVKNERRTDALLSYIHHARNTDYHGIENVTERKLRLTLRGEKGARLYGLVVDHGGQAHHHPLNTKVIAETTVGLQLSLVIDDRFGDTFNPPESHLGKAIQDRTPKGISTLAMKYLERLVRDGAEFTK